MQRWIQSLGRPVDGASVQAFRILFGAIMLVSAVRFMLSGWIPRLYAEPRFHFKYWGFEWVQPLPASGMYLVYGALAVLALLVMLGVWYRGAIALFCVLFAYTQLIDVTNYLNHHYLVVLLALLLCFIPATRPTVPLWAVTLLRFQIAVVYVYAGLAKLTEDWLLHAQPMNTWLTRHSDAWLIGPLLDEAWVAYAASWAGFLFDTTIVVWLSWRRTRPCAYAVLVGFHTVTYFMFNIGMFPFIMTAAATIFFDPSWPRRLLRRFPAPDLSLAPARPLRAAPLVLVGLYCLMQVGAPLRHWLYPGDVLWNEAGMRFSWKVMVREKHGSVTFHVRYKATGRSIQVSPRKYLDGRQEREMAGQPDLILQLAHRIAADHRARGLGDVEVRAEALVSLNGRRSRLLVDPTRDLAAIPDGLANPDWILPEPDETPRMRVASW